MCGICTEKVCRNQNYCRRMPGKNGTKKEVICRQIGLILFLFSAKNDLPVRIGYIFIYLSDLIAFYLQNRRGCTLL